MGAGHVDAVEIDPVINELGRRHHPNRPYSDPRVTIHLGRRPQLPAQDHVAVRPDQLRAGRFAGACTRAIRASGSRASCSPSRRFATSRPSSSPAACSPCTTSTGRAGSWAGWRSWSEQVFGSPPIVVSLPYQDVIAPDDNQRDYITFLLVGDGTSSGRGGDPGEVRGRAVLLAQSSAAGQRGGRTASSPAPPVNAGAAGRPVHEDRAGRGRAAGASSTIPTDDWPFLYLREPAIPALNLRGMAIVAVLSLVILLAFAPVRRARPNGRMFFLGAGFMLLETKGVVHMALALRLDLDGQLDRVLRDPGDDPPEQSLRAGRAAAAALAVLSGSCWLPCWSTASCRWTTSWRCRARAR